jgi:predicted DCC family thiol-disulfide oxidoreductase YuxK
MPRNRRPHGRSLKIVPQATHASPASRALLVFDGDCSFCTTWVNRLEAVLPVFPPTTPWQWIELDDHALTRDDVDRYAWVITPSHQYAGHLALSALLRMQPVAGLRLLGHLLATPPFSLVASLGYRVIAANRSRLPGGTPACALPRPS